MNFPYSTHSKQGVTCIDCHLEHLESRNPIFTGSDHSFKASVKSCADCHSEQMHADGEAAITEAVASNIATAEPVSEPTPALEMASITPEPKPVSPVGYAGIASLIGLAAGMLLAPNLERWYRTAVKKSEEAHHDEK